MSGITEEALRQVALAQPIEEALLGEDVWLSLTSDQRKGASLVAADTVRRVLSELIARD